MRCWNPARSSQCSRRFSLGAPRTRSPLRVYLRFSTSETRTGACGDWCQGPPSVEAAAESALALADAIEATFSPTTARDPAAAGILDAAKVRWAPCSGDAAALGAFPGTNVPSMGEIAAAPRREGGGGRGGRGGRGRWRRTWRREGRTTCVAAAGGVEAGVEPV